LSTEYLIIANKIKAYNNMEIRIDNADHS
jgi:hypothetical protein